MHRFISFFIRIYRFCPIELVPLNFCSFLQPLEFQHKLQWDIYTSKMQFVPLKLTYPHPVNISFFNFNFSIFHKTFHESFTKDRYPFTETPFLSQTYFFFLLLSENFHTLSSPLYNNRSVLHNIEHSSAYQITI